MADNSAIVGVLRVLLQSETADYVAGVKDAEKTTAGLAKSFGNLAKDLTGAKIEQKALDIVNAMKQVGSVSKLTERELAAVAATVNAATQKLQLMGKTVPPEIAKLSAEIKNLEAAKPAAAATSSLGDAFGTLQRLAPVLTVGGLATAVIGLGKAALDTADQVVTLSNRTGISTEQIQRMQYVAEQSGTSLEALTAGAFKLGLNLSEGTQKARDAVADLGLSFEDLKTQTPEQQFNTVIAALEGIEDVNKRNAIGVALFGKGFAEMATAVSDGYTKLASDAAVMSDAQIQALDRAGDAFAKFKRQLMIGVGEIMGSFMTGISEIERGADAMTTGEKFKVFFKSFVGMNEGYLKELQKRGQAEEQAAREKQFWDAAQVESTTTTTRATASYSAELGKAKSEVAGLSAVQKKELNAALAIGGDAAKKYAESINLSEAGLRLYQEQAKGGAAATKKLATEHENAAKALRAYNNEVGVRRMEDEAARLKAIEDRAKAERAYYNEVGQRELENEGARLAGIEARTEAEDKARREYNNWLGERRMAEDAAALESQKRGISIADSFKGAFQQVPQILMQAFTGGGDVGKSLGGLFGGAVFGKDSALMKNITGGLTGMLGKTMGGALSAIIPGLGTLAGSLLGGLTDKLVGMFGVSPEIKKAREELTGFQKTLTATATETQKLEAGTEQWKLDVIVVRDAYIATGRTAADAEKIVAQMWDTDDPKAAAAAIAEVNKVLAEQKKRYEENQKAATGLFDEVLKAAEELGTGLPDNLRSAVNELDRMGLLTDDLRKKFAALGTENDVDWKRMKEAADKYGISVDALGSKFQGARLAADAKEIWTSFQMLSKGGADVGGVLHGMRDEISALVRDSRKFGTTIPEQFRPLIQELEQSGNLLDENGEAIKGIGDLKFGPPIEDQFEKLVKKLDELITKITGPLTKSLVDSAEEGEEAFEKVEDSINKIPRTVPVAINPYVNPATTSPTEMSSAQAGIFRGRFAPQGELAVLHGTESVVPRADERAFAERVLGREALSTAGAGTSIVVLPLIPFTDPYTGAEEAARQFSGRVRMDSRGMRETIERVIEDYMRTYGE
jgi:hypothetical protein